ncbi:hypothetical protein F8A88_00915 [Pseudodesulfovibrio senegalensis]|jgi:hypothetical protein|uniref:Uncharacterized protein n=1 Tax=Pseudodesulfovibrio senegalensis TaxID=1721087 RepID=A0A6N6N5W5_9BACT|nr:hypothetical protein F8A88_00915 [Pseudodesulfovibrio senegalensis]
MKSPGKSENQNTVTVRGTVIPSQWDDRFEVTGVLIACRDERELRVTNLDCFPALKKLTRKEADFTGVVQKNGPVESIVLDNFTPVESDS